MQRLTSGTAVQWQPSGLASISGSLFPALASVSHGCLRVALQGDRLLAEGPVAPSPFSSLQPHHEEHQANFVRFDLSSAYLELNSVSLQPLLGCLFNNSLFAQQLDSRYGLPRSCAMFCYVHLPLYGSMRSRLAASTPQFKPA